MPELPEVQTIVDDLKDYCLHKKIIQAKVIWPGIVDNISSQKISGKLENRIIKNIKRRAKYIVITLDNDSIIAFHLRMSGQLVFQENNSLDKNKYRHIRFELYFDDNTKVIFNEMRKFGRVYYFSNIIEYEKYINQRVGFEPLEINKNNFLKLLENKKGNIKAFLLKQDMLCGLGNIYVDESLFKTGINPNKNISEINNKIRIRLLSNIKNTLKKAISLRGTSMRDYLDVTGNAGEYKKILNVYGRNGKQCKKCHSIIEKTVVAGRGTHFCPTCQKIQDL